MRKMLTTMQLLYGGSFIFLFFTIYLFYGIQAKSSPPQLEKGEIPGHIIQVSTRLGPISVRVLGNPGDPPVICLPGINPKLVDEWTIVGESIQQSGFAVYILNFHSNKRTVPSLVLGGISKADVVNVINDVMEQIGSEQVVLMGKSWGGGQAMNYAKEFPNRVSKLCLISPASSDASSIKQLGKQLFPIYLGWAKDDPTIWHSNTATWQNILGSKLTLHSADTGGHFILYEYSKSLIPFLRPENNNINRK